MLATLVGRRSRRRIFVVVGAQLSAAAPSRPTRHERRCRLPARLPTRELRVPILMYHRINVSPPGTPSHGTAPDGAPGRLCPSDEVARSGTGIAPSRSASSSTRSSSAIASGRSRSCSPSTTGTATSVRQGAAGARAAGHARDGIRDLRPDSEERHRVPDVAPAPRARAGRRSRSARTPSTHRESDHRSRTPRPSRELVAVAPRVRAASAAPGAVARVSLRRVRRAHRAARAASRLRARRHDGARRRPVGPPSARPAAGFVSSTRPASPGSPRCSGAPDGTDMSGAGTGHVRKSRWSCSLEW